MPDVIDGGLDASGLMAHTLISRFADHLPYYRQEAINARSAVHTPRSTLAAWAGKAGEALQPVVDAHKARRRNAGGALGPRRGQDPQGLRLGVCQEPPRSWHQAWSTTSALGVGRSTHGTSSPAESEQVSPLGRARY